MYTARFVHKVSPKPTDVSAPFELPESALSNIKELGAALRGARILCKGQRIRGMRAEGNKTLVFPSCSSWQCIILRPDADTEAARFFSIVDAHGTNTGYIELRAREFDKLSDEARKLVNDEAQARSERACNV